MEVPGRFGGSRWLERIGGFSGGGVVELQSLWGVGLRQGVSLALAKSGKGL